MAVAPRGFEAVTGFVETARRHTHRDRQSVGGKPFAPSRFPYARAPRRTALSLSAQTLTPIRWFDPTPPPLSDVTPVTLHPFARTAATARRTLRENDSRGRLTVPPKTHPIAVELDSCLQPRYGQRMSTRRAPGLTRNRDHVSAHQWAPRRMVPHLSSTRCRTVLPGPDCG